MSTTSISRSASDPTAPLRHFFGVAAHPQTYRNIAYLLLGLPLGTIWFTVLVSGFSVAISIVVVALLGIPMLLGMWYLARWLANAERGVANVLLRQHLPAAPMAAPREGNVWVRLRAMSRDRARWRELGYLMARFPVGVATFTAAVTALTAPLAVAYAPILARYDHDQPFGDWALSSRMEDVASSPWAWLFLPLGLVLLVISFHVLNGLARACARWTRARLTVG